MSAPHDRSLDDEGVPDLDGPLPEKVLTGDPQEGEPPPNDRPRASVDWGITPEEDAAGEPLERRLAREIPDTDAVDTGADAVELVGPEDATAAADADTEAQLVARAGSVPIGQGRSAEEAAVHVVEETAPGPADR
ncbi:MAG: DUF5709 domain-containing protein [Acidimicrobiia bacterium]